MSIYNGLLIRDYMQDKGEVPTKDVNPTMSPDIICYQRNQLSKSEAERTYDGPSICMPFLQDYPNNIYVRAKNTSEKDTLTGKVRLYLAPLNVLYMPEKWTQISTADEQKDVNFIDCDTGSLNIEPGHVALTEKAFYQERVTFPKQHYCMFALATDHDGNWLELEKDFENNTQLWNFLREHKQFANRNICIENPFQHTSTQRVDFGNYDSTAREFNLLVKFTSGIETAEDSELVIQSTDAACTFSQNYKIKPETKEYCCKMTVPPKYSGLMTVSIISKYPRQLECAYAVRNLLSASQNKDGITYHTRLLHTKSKQEELVEHMGDYGMIFTQEKQTATGDALLAQESVISQFQKSLISATGFDSTYLLQD